jgi:hypothetical protein
VVPQIEEVAPQEVLVPEPLDHYSVAQAKTEKPATRHHTHIVRPQPNFFEKLVAGFIKLQKPQAPKSFHKGSRTTQAAQPSKKRLSAHRRTADASS